MTLAPGRRGTVVLRAEPRAGADPLTEAAAGQLKESCDPYRLVLPAERETLAEYYADELRARLKPHDGAAERFLVAAPEVPLRFKAYDGKASFDGRTVSFRWFWTGASSAKWKAGDQSFPVADLNGVEWRSPRFSKVIYGCCAGPRRRCLLTRIRRLSCSGWGMGPCTSPCRSRRLSLRRCGRCGPVRWCRPLGAALRTSPSGFGISGSCISRGW